MCMFYQISSGNLIAYGILRICIEGIQKALIELSLHLIKGLLFTYVKHFLKRNIEQPCREQGGGRALLWLVDTDRTSVCHRVASEPLPPPHGGTDRLPINFLLARCVFLAYKNVMFLVFLCKCGQ